MAGQFVDVILSKVLHAFSFWNHIPNEFMILLKLSLLIRCIWIAVEDVASVPAFLIFFYIPGVFELGTVVSKYHLEILSEKTDRKGVRQVIDSIHYAFLGASLK